MAPLGTEDSGRTALYGAYLADVPAMYWETTHGGGGQEEYAAALERLMAHCEMIDAQGVLPPPAPRLFHENLGHGAGLMSSHNQAPKDGFWRCVALRCVALRRVVLENGAHSNE